MASESSGDFVLGFLVGTFVGAAMALLFAPISGEEMRTQLRERGIELKDRAQDLGQEASQRAADLRERGQGVIEQQRSRIQEAVDEGRQAAARRKEELLSQLENKGSEGVDLTGKRA